MFHGRWGAAGRACSARRVWPEDRLAICWCTAGKRCYIVPMVQDAACFDHPCDSCSVCRAGSCCRRDHPDYTLPEFGSWTGPVFGARGVLARDDRHAECHMCGRRFRMLATHVWKTHGVWADEYRAMFGLSASRGLVGGETHARLREVASEFLLPHHVRAVQLARARCIKRGPLAIGPRRLETRLGEPYQEANRKRSKRGSEIMRERLRDPLELARVREQLRPRGPMSVVCSECGATFITTLQGALSRGVVLCSKRLQKRA